MSMEPLIKIDSISIDLPNVTSNDNTGKCEHFCMRKYVSEMRQKESKLCFPFKSGLDSSKEESDALPPLDIPNFRWWQCPTCVQNIHTKTDFKEAKAVPSSSGGRYQSDNICEHSRSENVNLPSDFGPCLTLSIVNTKLVDPTLTNQENGHKGLPCDHEKEKTDGETQTSIQTIGPEDGLKNNLMLEIPGPTSVAAEVKISNEKEKQVVETVTKHANCNGYLDAFGQGCKSTEVAAVDNSTEKILPQKEISDPGQRIEVLEACGTTKTVDMVEPILDTITTNRDDHASAQLHGENDSSSDSDEICLGDSSQNLSPDKSVGPRRRRIRKMRLLTDLLGESGIASTDRTLNVNSPERVSEALSEIDAQSVKKASSLENSEKITQKRKRKLPSHGVSRHNENVITNKENEESVIENRDSGISKAIVASDKVDRSFANIGSCTVTKSHGSDQRPTMKNKKLKNHAVEVSLPDKTGEAGSENAENAIFGAGSHAFKDREDSLLSPAKEMERHSFMCKNKNKETPVDNSCNCRMKGKMPQADNIQVSIISGNNGEHGEGLTPSTDLGVVKARPTNIQTLSEDNSSLEIGLDLSLGNYLSAPNSDGKHASQGELRKQSTFLLQEGTSKHDNIMKKNVEMTWVEPSFPTKSVLDAVKGTHKDVNANPKTFFTNGRQKYASLMDNSQCVVPQKDNTDSSFKERSDTPLEHSAVVQRKCDKVAGMAREQGSPDDIPMEIVELMAKNQYERYRHDSDISETRNKLWDFQRMSSAPEHKDGEPNLLQKESTRRRQNPRKKITGTSKDFRTPQQNLIGHSSHSNTNYPNMSRIEQTYPSKRHGVFSPYPDNIRGVHNPMSGSSMHNNCPNGIRNEDVTGCRSSVPSFQNVGACKTCHIPRQSEESSGLWSSMAPSHIPYAYSFPPKFGLQSSNVVARPHGPRTPPKVDINWTRDPKLLSLNVTDLEKQQKNCHLEGLSRPNANNPYVANRNGIDPQNSYGSIDFYSNETIPAMHLLSLMDARRPSGENMGVNKTPRFSKSSTLPRDNRSKELLGLDFGIQKTADPLKHPSSEYRAINIIPGRYHECPSAALNTGPSSSMFQGNETFRTVNEVTAPLPSRAQDKGKRKCSDLVAPAASSSLKFALPIGNAPGKSQGCNSVHNIQRNLPGTPNSRTFPLFSHATESSERDKLEAPNSSRNVRPVKSGIEAGICTINRNPADFSIPEEGNIYTIGAKDFKFRKKTRVQDKVSTNKMDGEKRKSNMKFPPAKRQSGVKFHD